MAAYGKTSWGRAHYSGFRRGQSGVESGFADLGAFIEANNQGEADLSAEILTSLIKDLPAALSAIQPEDLGATLEVNPGADLPASTVPIPGVNLGAIGGGHFPEDLPATLAAVLPVDLGAELRPVDSDTADLGASLVKSGDIKHMLAYVKAATRVTEDLNARIRVVAHGTKDLQGIIQGWVEVDLAASIGAQHVDDIRAILLGFARLQEANLPAVIRRVDKQEADLGVSPLKAVVSTHTSDKFPNLDKVNKYFFENRYMLGTRGAGLALLTLEPIFGIFPDLHAEIFARDFFRENIGAFLRPVFPGSRDLNTILTSVVPYVNINKIILELIPLINMDAELVRVGDFLGNRANITPVHKGVTGTADDAGFVSTATTYKFYLGTNRGLFVPPEIVSEIRIETFTNNYPTPDLHGTVTGWHAADMGAYIKDYSFSHLSAEIRSWELDHISHLSASIGTFNLHDLMASATPSGAWEDLYAQLDVGGQVADLPTTLIPSINPLAYNVVSVSTKPFAGLGAIINYESFVRCAPTSALKALSAFIKPIVTGTLDNQSDMSASIISGRIILDLGGDIIGRKRTRIQTLNLTFRAKTRGSERIRGSITPVGKGLSDVAAQITGILHESDMPASLTPIRFTPHDVDFTATEKVVNLNSGAIKDVLISFRSQVHFYVYEEVTDAVYSTDRGTWAIDLRSLIRDESFFDRSLLNREYVVTDLQEFYSLDEALRHALVFLCERQQFALGATLTARGAINDLGVQIGIIDADRMSNLPSKLVAVGNSPDIAALINTSGQLSMIETVAASVTPEHVENEDYIGGSITGNIVNDLGAEITGT